VLGTLADDGTWAWTWLLDPISGGTRLVSRTRMATRGKPRLEQVATELLLIPASWLMERKMLQGLRQRAEMGMPAAGGGAP